MNKEMRWPLVAVLALALLAVAGMLWMKVPETTITAVVGLVVVPVLAAFGASHLAGTREAVQTVQQQTNGNTTRLLDIIAEQGRIIAASYPATPPATGDQTAPLPALPAATWPPAGAETTGTTWPAS